MDTVCISLGGSIISKHDGVNVDYIRKLKVLLKDYSKSKFIIVVGGGYASRLYIDSSRQIIKNNSVLDEIGIAITRINALILKDLISDLDVYPNVITSIDELRSAINTNRIAIMGGLVPGISTDSVATMSAEIVGSKILINVSSSSYVYDMPPDRDGAKKLKSLNHAKLIEIASLWDTREAGSNFVFDLMASKLARRGNIEVRFVNDDTEQLKNAIEGREINGTTVKE
ncbi:MAG: UMP kinase [Candidatus Marsarchaeota archaeon]|jgi:uridylate kinase|nr:UMP kinase [Candidatus Marsarchaeota archaeon]